MILEVRHLQMLQAIQREGSMTNAAKQLRLSQPAVSHALSKLENGLGTRLFLRTAEGMTPTAEGSRLLTSADKVIAELERAEHDVEQLVAGYQGVLRLTTECYTCYHWLPRLLQDFGEMFPRVDLQLVPEATNMPIQAIREGVVDVAVIHSDPQDDSMTAVELFSDELVAVVAPDHPWAGKSFVTVNDFAGEALVLHSRPDNSMFFTHVLQPAGVMPRKVHALQLTEAVLGAVKAQIGVSVMSRWAVQPELDAGTIGVARLTPDGLYRTWYAAALRRRADWAPVSALIDLLSSDALTAVRTCRLVTGAEA